MTLSENEQSQKLHYDAIASQYASARLNSRAHQVSFERWVRHLLEPIRENLEGAVVIDPMCGTAPTAPFILESNPHRLLIRDLSGAMMERVSSSTSADRRVVKLSPGSVTSLPLEDESVDAIVISGGLHHVAADLDRALSELHRVLRSGGSFVFGEPLDDWFPARAGRSILYRILPNFDHKAEHPYRSEELASALFRSGFCDISLQPVGSLGMLLSLNVNVFPFSYLIRSEKLHAALLAFDAFVESNSVLRRTCIAVTGHAKKGLGEPT